MLALSSNGLFSVSRLPVLRLGLRVVPCSRASAAYVRLYGKQAQVRRNLQFGIS